MLSIVQRGGATREKPPEVVRGMASRLPWAWDSLCFAVPFNDATRDSARDLVFNVAPSSVIGTYSWTRDDRGNAAMYLNNVSALAYPDTAGHNRPSSAITIYVRFRRVGTGDAAGGVIAKHWGADTPEISWSIQQVDAADNRLGASVNTGNQIHYWEASYTTTTTEWITAVVRWVDTFTPTMRIYGTRGQLLSSASNAFVVNGPIQYRAGEPIYINALHDYLHYNCEYSQAMVWSRSLTDTEVEALVADPYGWYSPRRETVGVSSPYPLAFGGGEMKFGTGSGGLR